MATLVLSAAGAAIGSGIGGTVLGVGAATLGRFAGASLGYAIDQKIMGQGSEAVETGRIKALRLTGSGEGYPVSRVFGRTRVAGHLIWASQFQESVNTRDGGGGGKGAPKQPETHEYSYSVSLAIALCEGEITHVSRIWADTHEIPRDSLTMRIYPGTMDQFPDPRIEAIEGTGQVPAYRGTAYVVIEDLDLGRFGNRIPQFSFEVCRPSQPQEQGYHHDPAHGVHGVALLPGSGEYVLATHPVSIAKDVGQTVLANVNSPSDKPDFLTSLDEMTGELPNCKAVSLVVSWFGDDLRTGHCTVRPLVEQNNHDGENMPWHVAGLRRSQARRVPTDEDGKPIYGGTPSDQSVIQAIRAMNEAGKEVMYYPFILMTQMQDNGLPDPYSDASDQPLLPWRGRITLDQAPGQDGSADGTAQAIADVETFFGTAQPADFSLGTSEPAPPEPGGLESQGPSPTSAERNLSPVTYSGPQEWSYRRFILHNAMLCAAAGGVESFCIGSEMRGLTQIRGPNNNFPAVEALISLAADVRQILGPDVKLSYAADWSEYFGYHPGGGTCFFHLDPLWADENIDFIGIDNYMPLSDWREEHAHKDASWGSIYNPDYLMANIQGGEGYDWYYHSTEARAAQIRTPITDEGESEPWVWRYKDIRNWWSQPHHDRPDGQRSFTPTAWIPRSKPIRFTEYGCAAIDKGTNQPNKFVDPKSSESSLPRYSNGQRDELMQVQYLRAMHKYWRTPWNNPVSDVYDAPMLDMDHAYVWAWDARPYPHFPARLDIWSDGENYARGHWLNGRVSGRSLASVVQEITTDAGLEHVDVSRLYGYVRGYDTSQIETARSALQPLLTAFPVDAMDRDGKLVFRSRDSYPVEQLYPGQLVTDTEQNRDIEFSQESEAQQPTRVQLRFVEADAEFDVIGEEITLHDKRDSVVSGTEMPLVMNRAEARQIATRWLAEARLTAETAQFTLPGSKAYLGPGDVVTLPNDTCPDRTYRIDRSEQAGTMQQIEAVRVDPTHYQPLKVDDIPVQLTPFRASTPVLVQVLDLPLLSSDTPPYAPHILAFNKPWPGKVAVYASDQDTGGYGLISTIRNPTRLGVLQADVPQARPDLLDKGTRILVRMLNSELHSIDEQTFLSGGNRAIISNGDQNIHEIIQFRQATLVGPDTYELRFLLRGLKGTEFMQDTPWPKDSLLILPGAGLEQLPISSEQRGLTRHLRIGPAAKTPDHPSYRHIVTAMHGNGLRPYAPVHLQAKRKNNSDLDLHWIRRTRQDGDRWDTPDVPLGEEREEYLVQITSAGTVLREEFVQKPFWTYTSGQQEADQISGQIQIKIFQLSNSYGPGRFAELRMVL